MKKIRLFEAFSGIGAQHESLKQLQKEFPNEFEFESVGVSEIDAHAYISYCAAHGGGKNYGDITKIDWSQVPDFDLFTYSFPCFVKGTLIHTKRGFIPIEDVTSDDYVLTHTNQYKKVVMVGSRPDASIWKVRGMCFHEILCTGNHPFYVRKRYREWDNPNRVWVRRFKDPEWLNASKLTKDHYIGYAINQESKIPEWKGVEIKRWGHPTLESKLTPLLENPDFWYIMGRYVGDGWQRQCKTSKGIVIAYSERNKESILSAMDRLGWHYTMVKERTVYKLHVCSREWYEFVRRFGYKAHGKQVDIDTINLPVHLLKSFVEGYIDSDGCYDEKDKEYKASTVSESLTYTMAQCISKVYKRPVRVSKTKRKPHCIIEGRKVNQRDTYSIQWHTDDRIQDKAFYEDGYVWFPIRESRKTYMKREVYNMEVEEDNSYTAYGAIVHNCQSVSNAGKQAGFTEGSGTTSSLLWECRRAIREKRPKFLIMENVKALTQKKFLPEFQKWISELESFGYANFWQVLNAKDYGTAQNRERVFMISILKTEDDPNPQYVFPDPIPLTKCVEDYMVEAETVTEDYFIDQDRITRKVMSDILEQKNVREEFEKLYHEQRLQADSDSSN